MVHNPDIPCSGGCGKLMWRSRTTAAVPMCRECRKADHGACAQRECDRPSQARGLCSTHYAAWWRRENGPTPSDRRKPPWINPKLRWRIYERDGYACQICGEPVSLDGDFRSVRYPSLDHIVPRSMGGSNGEQNLRTAHRICNALRGAARLTDEEVVERASRDSLRG